MDKMQAPIKSITLNSRTFHNATVSPTLVNFFFGKNGVGKSTIAEQLSDGIGVSPDLSDYDVLVYDKHFIDSNIKEDTSMPGVFSMNEGNIEIEEKIIEKENTARELENLLNENQAELDKISKMPDSLRARLNESCWNETKLIRDTLPLAMKNKRGKKSILSMSY